VSLVSNANPCSQRSTCSNVAKRHAGARWPLVVGVPFAGVELAGVAWLAPLPALAQATTAIVVAPASSRLPKPLRVVVLIVRSRRSGRSTLFAPRGPDGNERAEIQRSVVAGRPQVGQ
jgi:hypothetical protein